MARVRTELAAWRQFSLDSRSMTAFVGLLRAINVGGTGKLPMKELVELCLEAGFRDVKTYIQSGNVVFESKLSEARAQAKLAASLSKKLGKAAGVTLRTADELEAVLAKNPYKTAPGLVVIMFMNATPERAALKDVKAPDGEQLALGKREIYIHYPKGQGRSKLKIPHAKEVTGRNINTTTKLLELARALEAR